MTEVAEEMLSFPGVNVVSVRRKSLIWQSLMIMLIIRQKSEQQLTAHAKKYPEKEIIAVFQPHTFTRTIALMDEFAEALDLADSVYLCDIFGSARESRGDVKIEDLGNKIQKGGQVIKEENVSPLLDHQDAVIIFMGAGDVQKFESAYEKLLSNNDSKRVIKNTERWPNQITRADQRNKWYLICTGCQQNYDTNQPVRLTI